MKSILPPDGGPITVTSGTYYKAGWPSPGVLVMVEVIGGPVITLTPEQWDALVTRIRKATSLRELRA